LVALAPHLPEPLLPDALAAAKAISDDYPRADALIALATHLRKATSPEQPTAALAKGNDDLSEEDWLELECLSLKEEASRLSDSLDKTLEYIKMRCDVITGAA
jgi:hypothetical protein